MNNTLGIGILFLVLLAPVIFSTGVPQPFSYSINSNNYPPFIPKTYFDDSTATAYSLTEAITLVGKYVPEPNGSANITGQYYSVGSLNLRSCAPHKLPWQLCPISYRTENHLLSMKMLGKEWKMLKIRPNVAGQEIVLGRVLSEGVYLAGDEFDLPISYPAKVKISEIVFGDGEKVPGNVTVTIIANGTPMMNATLKEGEVYELMSPTPEGNFIAVNLKIVHVAPDWAHVALVNEIMKLSNGLSPEVSLAYAYSGGDVIPGGTYSKWKAQVMWYQKTGESSQYLRFIKLYRQDPIKLNKGGTFCVLEDAPSWISDYGVKCIGYNVQYNGGAKFGIAN